MSIQGDALKLSEGAIRSHRRLGWTLAIASGVTWLAIVALKRPYSGTGIGLIGGYWVYRKWGEIGSVCLQLQQALIERGGKLGEQERQYQELVKGHEQLKKEKGIQDGILLDRQELERRAQALRAQEIEQARQTPPQLPNDFQARVPLTSAAPLDRSNESNGGIMGWFFHNDKKDHVLPMYQGED